jgi:hypothetical protein
VYNSGAVSPHASFKIAHVRSGTYVLIALLFLLICGYVLDEIAVFPEAGGDEQELLSLDYRQTVFGERNDLVLISQSYGQREHQKLPFPWTGRLRSLFHAVVGCSPTLGRVFSALAILCSVLVVAVICPLRSSRSPGDVLLLLLVTGLSPPLYFAARTIRLEQEILFMGVTSLFLLPVLMRRDTPSSRQRSLGLWVLCGILSGWAAVCHPGGIVFAAVQLSSLLLFFQSLRARDGLGSRMRISAWLLGAAIPVIIVTIVIYSDLQNWRMFYGDMGARFVEVKTRLVDWWAPLWPFRIGSDPPILASSLYTFGLSATSPWMDYPLASLIKNLFFLEAILLALVGLPVLLASAGRSDSEQRLHLYSAVGLAAGFSLFHFMYAIVASPNYTFYPYLGLAVPLGFAWLSLEISGGFRKTKKESNRALAMRVLARLPLLIAFLSAILYSHFAIYQFSRNSSEIAAGSSITLDARSEALLKMGTDLGWSKSRIPVYIDNLTWRAAGPNWLSLFEAILSDRVSAPDGSARIAFQSRLFSSLLTYPGFGSRQLSADEKVQRLGALFVDKTLVGVLFEPHSDYCFYSPTSGSVTARTGTATRTDTATRTGTAAPTKTATHADSRIYVDAATVIEVGRIDGSGDFTRAQGCFENRIALQGGRAENLAPGDYLLLLEGTSLPERRIRLSVNTRKEPSKAVSRDLESLPIHRVAIMPALVEVRDEESAIVLTEMSSPPLWPDDLEATLVPLSSWR